VARERSLKDNSPSRTTCLEIVIDGRVTGSPAGARAATTPPWVALLPLAGYHVAQGLSPRIVSAEQAKQAADDAVQPAQVAAVALPPSHYWFSSWHLYPLSVYAPTFDSRQDRWVTGTT
jgi:hypothetical protein